MGKPEGFCTTCGFVVQSFEGLYECPNCGSKGIPCAYENQVQVDINLHELRILCIWSENWACRHPESDMKEVVYAIANRLRKQFPDHLASTALTMRDELAEIKEAGYDFETNHPGADTPELGEHYKPDLGE